MIKKILKDKVAVVCILILSIVFIAGIFAPIFAPNDPYTQDIANKFSSFSLKYPLGTDSLGRCVLSRLIYGIRPTIFLSLFTMFCTICIGTLVGLISGYFGGFIDELLMRICDIMLSFPSQVMILAIVGVLGVGIENVIFANIIVKWAWYARMIRGITIQFRHKNYMMYSKVIESKVSYVLFKHLLPNILAEIIILATLDMGWVILNISTLSFLGLGVQAPAPEWGAMLSEAKNVISTQPMQMVAPGLAILIVVAVFNLLGDSFRDALDNKEVA
ncbi:nickel/cobalt ABC transporter permease [uncultured Clostridium sp.]|jgi:nickel transport system permease protein|uniref:nickel/cobalt ABC transporter permease n=1 Tax=uncultured Clostridium sp. TaxID=59620 RepID=UPI0025E941D8|nr:nickel/cobalt ABC transporter permease [uncultured Clostridium sp.]